MAARGIIQQSPELLAEVRLLEGLGAALRSESRRRLKGSTGAADAKREEEQSTSRGVIDHRVAAPLPAGRGHGKSRPEDVRNDEVAELEAACRRLLSDPRDRAARRSMRTSVLTAGFMTIGSDPALVRGLINEARAHGHELVIRMAGPDADRILVNAVATRLCMSLAALREQLAVYQLSIHPRWHRH